MCVTPARQDRELSVGSRRPRIVSPTAGMLIGELDHRANAVTIALLLANVALLAVTPRKSDHDAVMASDPPVISTCGADLGRTRAPVLPYNPGTLLDSTVVLVRLSRSPRT
jgi:hypothetical protein